MAMREVDTSEIPQDVDELHPELLEQALYAFKGNVSAIARHLGRRRSVIDEYINTKPDLKVVRDDIRAGSVDKAETNIYDAVEKGDLGASFYILNTLGKDRGYTARSELTGPNGDAIPTTIVFKIDEEPKDEAPEPDPANG